ncbi:MAG: hypothetical protein J1F43_01805 [Muribaculaceae bacterium]|nr:hypothetical protein [Muribaculaceae bacterium]
MKPYKSSYQKFYTLIKPKLLFLIKKWFPAVVVLFFPGFFTACNKTAPIDPDEEAFIQLVDKDETMADIRPVRGVRSIKVRNIGPLRQVFNDSNYQQLEAARRMGIEPISGLGNAYFTKRPIVKIASNQYYQIDSLRHSIPYLVPEAAILLEDIGKNFIDSLQKRGGDSYKIKVTSLLRTPESVGRLRRVNVNATDSSTHQFATTFDISYTNFYCLNEDRQINQGDLKNLLAEVLKDLRDNGRCLVKYEYKTGCFHVTVN